MGSGTTLVSGEYQTNVNKRLATALCAYGLLGVVAAFAVHGKVLGVVVLILAYFAVRTVIADRMRLQAEREALERQIQVVGQSDADIQASNPPVIGRSRRWAEKMFTRGFAGLLLYAVLSALPGGQRHYLQGLTARFVLLAVCVGVGYGAGWIAERGE